MRILEENRELARLYPRRLAVTGKPDIGEFSTWMCDRGYAVIQEVDDATLIARGEMTARYNLKTQTATVF